MPPSLKAGDAVWALATKILGKRPAKVAFPVDTDSARLGGEVLGAGEGRKLRVRWTLPDGSTKIDQHGGGALKVNVPVAGGGREDFDSDVEMETSSVSSEDSYAPTGGFNGHLHVDSDDEIVEEEEEDAADRDLYRPHNLQWMACPTPITDCARSFKWPARNEPHLNWRQGAGGALGESIRLNGKSRLSYFMLMAPDALHTAVAETSKVLVSKNKKPITLHEMVKILGVIVALGVGGKRIRRDNWGDDLGAIFRSANFGGRFGVGLHRFEDVIANWQWWPSDGREEGKWSNEADRWRPVRWLYESFNRNMQRVFNPGYILCADESTCRWTGFEAWHPNGCPHVTKIARKPEPLSVEVRDLCDALSEMFLFVEIQEGKEAMSDLEYCGPGVPAGTAFMLRATKAWHGTGRVVLGDSAFASVTTAIALRKAGLFFTGLVKTATKFFPKAALNLLPLPNRGDTGTLTAVKDGVELIAHVWADPNKPGKPHKQLISTWGTTLPADPALRTRYRMDPETGLWQSYKKSIPRTVIVEQYFKYCGAIDRANRVRQDGFRLEKNFEVKNWENRVITSLWGFVAANAFTGHRMEGCKEDQAEWQEGLAYEMLTNELDGCPKNNSLSTRSAVPPGGIRLVPGAAIPDALAPNGVEDPSVALLRHDFRPVKVLQTGGGAAKSKGTCKVCRDPNASLFCVSCSNGNSGGTCFLCGPHTGRQCLSWHCQLS